MAAVASKKSPLSHSFGGDSKATEEYYDKWSTTYDEDVKSHDYNGPKYMVQLCDKYINKNALILCVGAGTGLEGTLLHQLGFDRLHGHDGSNEMLKKARDDNVFDEYYVEMLQPNAKSQFRTDYYDAMVCVGCFVPGGLDERHVEDLMRPLKQGGLAVIGTREIFTKPVGAPYNYDHHLDDKIKSMVASGKLAMLERCRVENYSEAMPGVFYVTRKC